MQFWPCWAFSVEKKGCGSGLSGLGAGGHPVKCKGSQIGIGGDPLGIHSGDTGNP